MTHITAALLAVLRPLAAVADMLDRRDPALMAAIEREASHRPGDFVLVSDDLGVGLIDLDNAVAARRAISTGDSKALARAGLSYVISSQKAGLFSQGADHLRYLPADWLEKVGEIEDASGMCLATMLSFSEILLLEAEAEAA